MHTTELGLINNVCNIINAAGKILELINSLRSDIMLYLEVQYALTMHFSDLSMFVVTN